MDAIPSGLTPEQGHQISGIACPDCAGVLQVRMMGPRHTLEFVCRIGHTYTLIEMLAAKEDDLEARSWAAVLAAEEMAAIFHGLLARDRADGEVAERFRQRRDAATRFAVALHHVDGIYRAKDIAGVLTRLAAGQSVNGDR